MTDLEKQDLIYDQIRGILGEHFHNFCFVVMDEDGDLFYDYTNYRIGKMLMTEAAAFALEAIKQVTEIEAEEV